MILSYINSDQKYKVHTIEIIQGIILVGTGMKVSQYFTRCTHKVALKMYLKAQFMCKEYDNNVLQ